MSNQVIGSEFGAPARAVPEFTVVTRGDVPGGAGEYARTRLGALLRLLDEPVLFARIKLTMAPDPARERPAIAEVAFDINGEIVRAHIAATGLHEAIDLLHDRMRTKLEHRAERREATRRRSGVPEPGSWRHGDIPPSRPEWFDRPAADRQVVSRKSFAVVEMTPDEAAFDMEQADFDFYLFRELATGADALIERRPGGSCRLTRVDGAAVDPGPTAVVLTVADRPAPELTVDEAIERLEASAAHHLFFADPTGRGSVVYHRYDGHYGVITPA